MTSTITGPAVRGWPRDRIAMLAAVVLPLAVAAGVAPLRGSLANTDAALVLVLVVVAVAANGYRAAGILASVMAGVWYDFFLTEPLGRFTIHNREDVETTVLLLLVGIAVTEIAVWGRRQHAEASRQAGYLAGIQDAIESVADEASPTVVIDRVRDQLTRLFSLRECRFDYGRGVVGGDHPRLLSDGQVEVSGTSCDVDHLGLPLDRDIELPVRSGATYRGRFLLSATVDSRPSLTQRMVAVALADRVGAALSQHHEQQG
jgi:hypothetical protein